MVCFDNYTTESLAFGFAKILIDTCQFQQIHGVVYLSIDGIGFDVYMKEENMSQIVPLGFGPSVNHVLIGLNTNNEIPPEVENGNRDDPLLDPQTESDVEIVAETNLDNAAGTWLIGKIIGLTTLNEGVVK